MHSGVARGGNLVQNPHPPLRPIPHTRPNKVLEPALGQFPILAGNLGTEGAKKTFLVVVRQGLRFFLLDACTLKILIMEQSNMHEKHEQDV